MISFLPAIRTAIRMFFFCACFCAITLHAQSADAPDDAQVQQSLQELFTSFSGLRQVEVAVTNGVVTLQGEVNTVVARDQAVQLAELAQGAEGVTDNITVQADIYQRLTGVWNNLRLRAIDTIARLPLLMIAVTVVVLFWLLSRFVTSRAGLYNRMTRNPFLQSLLKQISFAVMLLIGFVLALEILDATALLGTILGAAGIVGLAVGFAIRDTVENFLASILLSLRQPFDPKDHIVIEGHEGKVVKLTSRETILMTPDGNHIRIPNATVYKGVILNYSRNSLRQLSFERSIDNKDDIRAATCLAIETMSRTPGVIANPSPNCLVKTLGDTRVVLLMLAWTDQKLYDYGKVRSEAIKNVKEAFDNVANLQKPQESPKPILDLNHAAARTDVNSDSRQKPDVSVEHYLDNEISKENAADEETDLLKKKKP